MSAAEIMRKIEQLPPQERAEIVRFTGSMKVNSCDDCLQELGKLAERLVVAKSDAEAEVIKQAMIEGFYGTKVDA